MTRPSPSEGRARFPGTRRPEHVLGQLLLAFEGYALPEAMGERLGTAPAAGLTLFRYVNVDSPGQVRELVASAQHAARRHQPPDLPLLVAADQEGGQLIALGEGTTPFAGNMALGAAGDVDLSERVGRAIGTELRAMGVNVAYAPSCDLATNTANPALGIRSFGDDPGAASALAASFIRGLRSVGVAATAKHFPGLGDVSLDSHHVLPTLEHERTRLDAVELVPFRAAIEADVDLVMSAHMALPALTGDATLPATLSGVVMTDVLRGELGFDGVSITDALDMAALGQGDEQILDVLAALRAGVDLLLCAPDEAARRRIEAGLVHAAARGLVDQARIDVSLERVARLRRRLGTFGQPDLSVVACSEHRQLARELAERSITVVRDDAGQLPLRLDPDERVAAIMPVPHDLTPADTSSTVKPGLATGLRRCHRLVDEFVTGHPPTAAEIASLRERAADYAMFVVGTIAASGDEAQADLVNALLATGVPIVTVALRTPFDLAAYPQAATHVCSYGILQPSLDALADAIFGRFEPTGQLPAAIPGLFDTGHRRLG